MCLTGKRTEQGWILATETEYMKIRLIKGWIQGCNGQTKRILLAPVPWDEMQNAVLLIFLLNCSPHSFSEPK